MPPASRLPPPLERRRRPLPDTLPYGSWPSPVTADVLAAAGVGLGPVTIDGGAVWWLESRPTEGGRSVLVRREAGGRIEDVTPAGFNVRTLVHEYGGGAFCVREGTAWFSHFADQRLYRQAPGQDPAPITPEPPRPRSDRYADADVAPDGRLLYCVRERHPADGEAVNALVVIPTDGSADPVEVAAGSDFCSFPRVSPDGTLLAWTTWDHPRMPWDGTLLHVAAIAGDGTLTDERVVMGGDRESVFQPQWSPDGVLHAVSDRSGWWNLYRLDDEHPTCLHAAEAEFGTPQWVFGLSTYAFLDDGSVACIVGEGGLSRLTLLGPDGTRIDPLVPWRSFPSPSLRSDGRVLVCSAASATTPVSVVRWEPGHEPEILRRSFHLTLDPGLVSVAEPVTFPTEGGEVAHALYYPPSNPAATAPAGARPPLLVHAHGGPTSAAHPGLSLAVQYWTSRGFAFCDVNYRGSSGYGRTYRDRLLGGWGMVDVADCVHAARHLAGERLADPHRLAVTGGSAGGYVALCALAFHDAFAAGVSHYGVADLGMLAQKTHKFESRYLDGLVGPWPQAQDVYQQRSPLHHADRITAPLLLMQGLEDEVVPPEQAEQMVAALAARGTPHAYIAFPGEQHGWRQAATIKRAAEAELAFYGQVLGFAPADDVEPVELLGGSGAPG